MFSKPSIHEQISKWASNAERKLNSPNMPGGIAELRQKVLVDFRLLKLLVERGVETDDKGNNINLQAGKLNVAVSKVDECGPQAEGTGAIESLIEIEKDVHEAIRKLFG